MIILSFDCNEEALFAEIESWLSEKFEREQTIILDKSKIMLIDPIKRRVLNQDKTEVNLTSKEFDVLYFLYIHKGQVFTKQQIYEQVWGYNNNIDPRSLSALICRLRKKIEPDPTIPIYILTVWGVGYKFTNKEL